MHEIELTQSELRPGEIRLQRDCGLIGHYRLLLPANQFEDVAEIVVRGRHAGVEAKRGGERRGRWFKLPDGEHRDAKIMLGRRYAWIELDRTLEQWDSLSMASRVDQTNALACATMGFARLRR